MQEEILDLLEKQEKPLSRTEIARMLNEENLGKISSHIQRLLKHKEIKSIEINRKTAMKFYNTQHRMRLYYIKKHS